MNKVLLIGNVGKVEIKSTSNGKKIALVSLATEERWKDKTTGERKKKTEWHRVAVYAQGIINVIERFVQPGTQLQITGQLRTRKYTASNGENRYTTEVAIEPYRGELTLLGSPRRSENRAAPAQVASQSSYDDAGYDVGDGFYNDQNVPF